MNLSTILTRTIDYCERAIARPAGIGLAELEEFSRLAAAEIAKPVETVRTAGEEVTLALAACRGVVNHFGQGEKGFRWQAVVGVLLPMVRSALSAEFAKQRGMG